MGESLLEGTVAPETSTDTMKDDHYKSRFAGWASKPADPLMREWLWHRMWELDRIVEFPIYVLGPVDVALWDLAGKAAGRLTGPAWFTSTCVWRSATPPTTRRSSSGTR